MHLLNCVSGQTVFHNIILLFEAEMMAVLNVVDMGTNSFLQCCMQDRYSSEVNLT